MTIIIDSITYDVPVLEIVRKAEFLDRYAERTEDGVLHRDLIGRFFNYQIKFGNTTNTAVYDALWLKLTEAVTFHTVTVPGNGSSYTFTAYFSGVSDSVRRINDSTTYWKDLTANFIAKEPAP